MPGIEYVRNTGLQIRQENVTLDLKSKATEHRVSNPGNIVRIKYPLLSSPGLQNPVGLYVDLDFIIQSN